MGNLFCGFFFGGLKDFDLVWFEFFFLEGEIVFHAALRALFPFRNFQQLDDESLQTANKELNLVILSI